MDDPCSRYLLGLGMNKPRQAQVADRIEQAKTDFGDIYGQVVWLADRLSEARILVNYDQCCRCSRYSFEECRKCWCEASAKAVREGRHSR